MRKYKLLKPRKSDGLRRIKYLIDIDNKRGRLVKAGDLGGFLSGYHNLSQEGLCVVLGEAEVLHQAHVSEDAVVSDKAIVAHIAKVYGRSTIRGDSYVCNDSTVCGFAVVSGNATVGDLAVVRDNAFVAWNASIGGDAVVKGSAVIKGYAHLTRGEWRRTPMEIIVHPFDVREDGDGIIRVGCQSHHYEDWVKNGHSIAAKEGIPRPMFELYKILIESIHKAREVME